MTTSSMRLSQRLRLSFSIMPPRVDSGDLRDHAAADQAAFLDHSAARLDHHGRVVALVCLVFTLVWWPFDPLIYGATLEALLPPATWRLAVCAFSGLYLLLPRPAAVRRRIFWLLTVMLMASMFALGYASALMGGLDRPWIHLGYMVLYAPLLFPLALPRRAAMNVLQAIGWLAGVFVANPRDLASPYLPMTLSFTVCVVLASLGLGHFLYLLGRENFLQARALARSAALLEDRVTAKTREIRQLLAHLERAREDERKHISRELHDELGQELAALRYALAYTRERFRREPTAIDKNLGELDALLARTTRSVRGLVSQLRPVALDDLGLRAAFEWLIQRASASAGIRCEFTCTGDDAGLPGDLVVATFRVFQEALTNVLRHAEATRVEVALQIGDTTVDLRVRDDGVGFDPAASRSGLGVLGMHERALALGAEIRLTSSPGAGTELACTFPRRPAPEHPSASSIGRVGAPG